MAVQPGGYEPGGGGGNNGGGGGSNAAERRYKKKLRRYERKQEWLKAQPEDLPPDLDLGAGAERELAGFQNQAGQAQVAANNSLQSLFSENFDPNNPFNNQALLQRNFEEQHKSTSLGFGAKGHLFSGAHEAQQGRVAFEEQRAQDQLLRGYMDNVNAVNEGLYGQLTDLQSASEEAIWNAAQIAGDPAAGTAAPLSRLASRPRPEGGNRKPRKPRGMR